MSMLPHVINFCKSAFYRLSTISRIRKYLSSPSTEILIHTFGTSKLDHCNSLRYINVPKNVIKKLPWVQNAAARLITRSHVITSLPSSSVFTGYLFLNELNSRFYYLPSRLCISNLQPTFKTYWPATYRLDRFDHLLRSVWILLAVSAPNLENKLPDDTRSCENLNIFKYELKTYLFKNYYFIHQKDFLFLHVLYSNLNLV